MVVVQGIGFVGAAMVGALACARDKEERPIFAVIGVDRDDESGAAKIRAVLAGRPPVVSSDASLAEAYCTAKRVGNLTATAHPAAFCHGSVVVIDVNLDVRKTPARAAEYALDDQPFLAAVETVAKNIVEDTLVLVETTVPPGTTERIVLPIVAEALERRGLDPGRVQIAHSYERVMPGPNYLSSITDLERVFAGVDETSSRRARAFLESFINTAKHPLFQLHSTTASEMAKVLENSYRAINIALIQEWSEFAQVAAVDLFQVVQAIRVRPTHRNIMQPGFGVGGYCLTKDSMLGDWSARNFFGRNSHLEMALRAVDVNDAMPLHTFSLLKEHVPDLAACKILVLGVSYRNDLADTRSSPTEILFEACRSEGASVYVHDTMLSYWPERRLPIDPRLESLRRLPAPDAVVFAVRHKEYLAFDAAAILDLFPNLRAAIDANNVITDDTAAALSKAGIKVAGVGKGHWRRFNKGVTSERRR